MFKKIISYLFKRFIVKKYSDYLINGEFCFNNSGNICYNKKSDIKIKTFDELCKINMFQKIFVKLNNLIGIKIKNNKEKKFNGLYIVFTSSDDHVKIFNNDEIITIYKNNKQLKKILSNYEYLKSIGISVPPIIKVDYKHKFIIEKKINTSERQNYDDILNEILKIYLTCDFEYIKNKPVFNNKYISNKLLEMNKNNEIDDFEINFLIKCHGDLWSSNILLSDKLYLIDYENVDYYSFIYDFFHYMFSELYLRNNNIYIQKYFNGYYDQYLNDIFAKYNYKYKKNRKKEYMNYFIYLYANTKWKNLPKNKIDIEFKKLNKIYLAYSQEVIK